MTQVNEKIKSEKSSVDQRIAEIDRELAEINARLDISTAKMKADFDDLRIRNERRSDYKLANYRKTMLGQLAEWFEFGAAATNEEIRNGQDNAALKNIEKMIGVVHQGGFVHDPLIKKAAHDLRLTSLLTNYYSGNSLDDSENRLVYDVPKWTIGYVWAGPLGAAMSFVNSMNLSMSSKANFFQMQKMKNSMTGDYLKTINAANIYSMNDNREWLDLEVNRAASSTDALFGRARIEFQNFQNPAYDNYATANTFRMKHEGSLISNEAKYQNEQRRLTADLGLGFGLLGGK